MMDPYMLVSISAYFIFMLGIGWYASTKTRTDIEGYLLGGRQLSPSVTALSAGASDMSGWILMGLPGAMFVSNSSAVWIVVGLVIGAYCNYRIVAPKIRIFSEIANNAVTIPDYLSNRLHQNGQLLRVVSAVVIIIFFTLYTSAGFVAGGKFFESAFSQPYEVGIFITASVVVIYTLVGGFLAVSMTDFAQGCIMIIALVVVPWVAFLNIDVSDITVAQTELLPEGFNISAIISGMAWGLGYFGQPHIIVRFMAIRSVDQMPIARRIGISWMVVSIVGALLVGLIGRIYVVQHSILINDPEIIFIVLSQLLFEPLIAGVLLSAILAAIMSTISSQLLVSAGSLSEDLYHRLLHRSASQRQVVYMGRIAVVTVSLIAAYLAINPNETILDLVGNAWAGFGAAFGPVIILSLIWSRLSYYGAISGMISGAAIVLWWSSSDLMIGGETLSSFLYELVPGFIGAFAVAIGVSYCTKDAGYESSRFFK